ncbi:TetR/AcrR family transcriptional regulator [Janibacter terrae]|uniref:TetR/AcrR family transcriptional regulator n=1 Tax=Janibacter terrae TaxID=103817 RepID=UPI0031FA2C9D
MARGRRPGERDTRADILVAARGLFATKGFDGTSVRAVAREAEVDPALVHHYFAGKASLFAEVVGVPPGFEDEIVAAVEGPREGAGERIVRTFLAVWDSPQGRAHFQAMIGAVATHEGAARLLQDFVVRTVFVRIAANFADGEDVDELAVAAVGAQMVGLGMLRYVVRLPAMVEADPEDLVAVVGPAVQRLLAPPT